MSKSIVLLFASLVAGSLFLAGCAEIDAPEEGVSRVAQAINTRPAGCTAAGVCRVDFALSNGAELHHFGAIATSSVKLANRAEVQSASSARSSVLSTGSGGVHIGGLARLGAAFSAAGMQIDSGASLTDRAFAAGQIVVQSGAQVAGPVLQNQPFFTHPVNVVPAFDMPSSFAPGVSLEPDASRTISAGAFSSFNVKSRASLSLGAGVYFVGSLTLEPQGKLRLSNATSPVEIHVLDTLNCKGDWLPAFAAPNVRIVYWGTAASVVECSLPNTSIVAPNAHIRIADRKSVNQVLAKSVELGVEAVARAIPHRSFVTGPSAKLLRDLSSAERLASCRALQTLQGAANREIQCRLEGNSEVVTAQPETSAQARDICTAKYEDCIAADPCATPETVPASCEATVGDRDSCLSQLMPRHYAASAAVPVCGDTTIYAAYTYHADAYEMPAGCAAYFKCLGVY